MGERTTSEAPDIGQNGAERKGTRVCISMFPVNPHEKRAWIKYPHSEMRRRKLQQAEERASTVTKCTRARGNKNLIKADKSSKSEIAIQDEQPARKCQQITKER
jgi:hypothetical protein